MLQVFDVMSTLISAAGLSKPTNTDGEKLRLAVFSACIKYGLKRNAQGLHFGLAPMSHVSHTYEQVKQQTNVRLSVRLFLMQVEEKKFFSVSDPDEKGQRTVRIQEASFPGIKDALPNVSWHTTVKPKAIAKLPKQVQKAVLGHCCAYTSAYTSVSSCTSVHCQSNMPLAVLMSSLDCLEICASAGDSDSIDSCMLAQLIANTVKIQCIHLLRHALLALMYCRCQCSL